MVVGRASFLAPLVMGLIKYRSLSRKSLPFPHCAPLNKTQVTAASDAETHDLSGADPPVKLGSPKVATDTDMVASSGRIIMSIPLPWTCCSVWKETSLEDAIARDISHDLGAARDGSSMSLLAVREERLEPGQTRGKMTGLW